jgi:hypothetical protein
MFIGIIFLVVSMVIDTHAMKLEKDTALRKKYMRSNTTDIAKPRTAPWDLSLHKKNMRSSVPDVVQTQSTDTEKTVRKVTYLNVSDNQEIISRTQICTVDETQHSSVRKSPRVSPRSSPSGSLSLPKSSPRKTLKNIKKYFAEADDYQEIMGQGLLVAARENSLSKIRDILYPNLNVIDEEGKTPLIIVIQNGKADTVRELLEGPGIDVNKADMEGNTPLHHAVLQGNDEITKLLLYDPRVNSLLKNRENHFAHQFLDNWHHQNLQELKLLFFSRSRLDAVVEKEIMVLLMCAHERSDSINQSILFIKDRITQDHEKQKEDRAIPEMVKSPINDDFIRKMLLYRLACTQDTDESHKIKIIINNFDTI